MKTVRLANAQPSPKENFTPPADPFAPGTQVLGKYTIVRMLGQGGMGVVVAARHNRLGEMHALKFLLPGAVADQQTLGRFEREARAAARLRGEHAVRVHDVGYTETDQPYMVMEYFEGQNLRTILRRGPLPIDEAIQYILQICDALTEVHTAGIVHRDVKPANLLLTMRPTGTLCLKLLDFGIAKFMGMDKSADIEEVDLTCDAMIGSLRYMSPEHIASTKSVDWRTDLWALGVTAYELLSCKTPFPGSARMDIMTNILDKNKNPDPLHIARPDCPPQLESVIMRCLEKDRNRRYQTASEVAQAFREAMGLPSPMLAPNRAQMPSSTTASTVMSIPEEPERRQELASTHFPMRLRPNRPKAMLVAGAVTFLTLGLFVFGAALGSPEQPGEATRESTAAPGVSMDLSSSASEPVIADAGNDVGLVEMPDAASTATTTNKTEKRPEKPASPRPLKVPPSITQSPIVKLAKTSKTSTSAVPTTLASTNSPKPPKPGPE